jgi:hypothetical protein
MADRDRTLMKVVPRDSRSSVDGQKRVLRFTIRDPQFTSSDIPGSA